MPSGVDIFATSYVRILIKTEWYKDIDKYEINMCCLGSNYYLSYISK